MKKLPVTLVLVITPLIVLPAALIAKRMLSTIDAQIAEFVSGGILTSMAAVYNFLRTKEIRVSLYSHPQGVEGIEKLTLKWYIVILYGTIVTAGIIQVYAGLMGFEVGYFSPDKAFLSSALDILGIVFGTLVLPLIYYLAGTWVGKRSNKYKPIVVIAIVIFERVLNLLLTFFIIPDSMIVDFYGVTKKVLFQNPALWAFSGVILTLGIIFGLLGVWRGHKARMSGYLEEVFKVLPDAVQRDVVMLSYEEAQRTVTSSPQKDKTPTVTGQ